eukprot:2608453-Prymnesium_polylepis.1
MCIRDRARFAHPEPAKATGAAPLPREALDSLRRPHRTRLLHLRLAVGGMAAVFVCGRHGQAMGSGQRPVRPRSPCQLMAHCPHSH